MVQLSAGAIVPMAGVTQYDLNTPLFSDYAVKTRTVWLPAGKTAAYDAINTFDFPTGTVFTKSFGFKDDFRKTNPLINWVETRVLLKSDSGWQGYAYLWNQAHTDATLDFGGRVQSISWLDEAGATQNINYLVPSFNQCKQCHQTDAVMNTIGPKARNLNRSFPYGEGTDNQLTHWAKIGILTGAPAAAVAPRLPVWNDPSTGSVNDRARAYLETNCAHCHNAHGAAASTGLSLGTAVTDPTAFGTCKPPVAAGEATGGNQFDAVPGDPAHSIITYRLASTKPSIAMPQIGRAAVDKDGLQLVSDWISGLPGGPCH